MEGKPKRFCVEDLKREREKCNFNQEELTNILDGGKEFTDRRRRLANIYLNDPAFEDEIPLEYLSYKDLYANELRKACHTLELFKKSGLSLREFFARGPSGLMKEGSPLLLHMSVFYNTLLGQADEEQKQRWLPKAERGEMIGAYAQTELGHGSFLRGLETTATYDQGTGEFVLHSPTITATKWWPGGLGKTANYAVVMAQLYTKKSYYGPHLFLVKIRDEKTHRSLPGVKVGEIGPRLGMNANDNGFLRFENYRIPRRNMFMKYSRVLEDGTYVKPPHGKLVYGSMVITRVGVIKSAYDNLRKAVTIAVRYSAVRRQSELVPGEPEPQILDYQTQQYKLIPQIASVFALFFAARSCGENYQSAMVNIEKGIVGQMAELHAISSGLKALSSNDAASGVEICRLACGGHGYLASSNLPCLYGSTTPMNTYEGENTVLLLQVARYLIKSLQNGQRNGTKLPGSVSYLTERSRHRWTEDVTDRGLVEAYKLTSLWLVTKTEEKLKKLSDSGLQFPHAWNRCSVSLVKCAEVHTRFYVCNQYLESMQLLKASEGVKKILRLLCRLYLIHQVTLNAGDFLKAGVLSTTSLSTLEEEQTTLLSELRPQAVSIVDAFDIHERLLDSTIGAYDGNVYERLYKEALKNPLNKQDVPEAYHQYLRPIILKANL